MSAPASDKMLGLYATLHPVRIAFTDTLFTPAPFKDPKTGKPKGDPKYSCLVFWGPDHPDFEPMKKKAIDAARASWPGVELKDIGFPFRNGDKDNAKRVASGKKARDFVAGLFFLTGRSQFAPRLSGFIDNTMFDYEDEATRARVKGTFFSGTDALVEVNFFPNIVDDKKYVTPYLNHVMTLNRGTRIAGGRKAADVFKGFAGHAATEDPTGGEGIEDDIAF